MPNGKLKPSWPTTTLTSADLELYNIRTDAWGLITIALLTLLVADALPFLRVAPNAPAAAKRPFAKAMVWATMLHHVTTGIGSYGHWARDSHNTTAMAIGVWGNVFLTLSGFVALSTLGSGGAVKQKI